MNLEWDMAHFVFGAVPAPGKPASHLDVFSVVLLCPSLVPPHPRHPFSLCYDRVCPGMPAALPCLSWVEPHSFHATHIRVISV